MKKILLSCSMVAMLATAAFAQQGSFKDARDGQTYKTVKIGNQVWMAKNLNYRIKNGSMCFEGVGSNCKKYGHLYTWEAALNACPSGWRLPSKEDFDKLLAIAGKDNEERFKNLLSSSENRGKDKFGFSVLRGGTYEGDSDQFFGWETDAYFWSSTDDSRNGAYALGFNTGNTEVDIFNQNDGYSVRCIKD